jgi:hypothetical protein
LRIEYFKGNLYRRIYAAPSANPGLHLGYLLRFGRWTVYIGTGTPVARFDAAIIFAKQPARGRLR